MAKKYLFNIFKKVILLLSGSGLGKISFFNYLYSFLLGLLKPEIVERSGYKLYLDKSDSMNISIFDGHSVLLRSVLKDIIHKGMTVADVGAHIGYLSLEMSRLVGVKGKVYAFEPDKENYDLLKKNIEINNVRNIVAEGKAVSNKTGYVNFLSSGDSQRRRMVSTNNLYRSNDIVIVPSITLNDYFKNIRLDVVKIDVEGAELRVLEESTEVLKRNVNIKLIIEFCISQFSDYGYKATDLLIFLRRFNFNLYDIDEINRKLIKITDNEIVNKYCNGITNILCSRE